MSSPAGIEAYLNAAAEAEKEALREQHKFIAYINELDELFRALVTGKAYSRHRACGFLSMNAHSSFLAATSTALRAQFAPTFVILRNSVESALYAYLVSRDGADGDLWQNRANNPDPVKVKFTANRAIQKLAIHDPNLATMARDTYEWMIEFGGHPNPRSIIDHIKENEAEADGTVPFSMAYIHAAGSVAAIRCLAACVENGCLAVAIIAHAMPDHPSSVGTFKTVWNMFGRFQELLAEDGYWSDQTRTE